MTLDAVRVALLLFVAALLQVTLFSTLDGFGGTPDVLLLTLVGIALLRGALAGAIAGFAGGLLVDVLTLDTLGITSLLLLLAGYWTGRYGETTGRDRTHAPILSVVVVTVLVALAGTALHFVLGDEVSARRALGEALLPSVGLNLLLAVPVLAAVRMTLGTLDRGEQPREVQLLG